MNYFRFKWNLSGFDSSGYESETYDRIIFKDGREIVLEGDKTYTTFTGDKGNGIGPSASTVLRGNMTFENACQTHALNPQMDEGQVKAKRAVLIQILLNFINVNGKNEFVDIGEMKFGIIFRITTIKIFTRIELKYHEVQTYH